MRPGYTIRYHDRVPRFNRIAVDNDQHNNIVILWLFCADWSCADHMMYGSVAIWKIKWK